MEKINIAELLKDCPSGMELDCLLCNSPIALEGVGGDESAYPIRAVGKDGFHHVLTKYGASYNHDDAKCVIFPKGKTTWEGFHRPFKDGDIIYVRDEYSDATFTYVAILKQIEKGGHIYSHCFYDYESAEFSTDDYLYDVYRMRFATEEEKAKLFQAIKDNGYEWNSETKTLEKMNGLKFKIGDRITNGIVTGKIRSRDVDSYQLDNDVFVFFSALEKWKLDTSKFNTNTLVPFESRVLMRSSNAREWTGTIFSHYSNNKFYGCGMCCDQCIPYEGNEHLLGKTDDCDEYFKTWE